MVFHGRKKIKNGQIGEVAPHAIPPRSSVELHRPANGLAATCGKVLRRRLSRKQNDPL